LELIDVQHRPEGGRMVLRLLLDRPEGGVTLDDLTRMSRELGDVLDAHDAVPGRYHLECSSPGLNRPLIRPEHYARAVGRRVRVETQVQIGGRRRFHGRLEGVTGEGITLEDPDVGTVAIAFPAIDKANIEFEFGRPAAGRQA
jgi:ribosome maturation factor RimP